MNDEFKKPFTSPPTIYSISVLVGIIMEFLFPTDFLNTSMQLILGVTFVLTGIYIIYTSIQEIEKHETTYDPYAASEKLVTSGIYKYSRNPGYLGLLIIQIGIGFLIDSSWVIATAFIATIITNQFVIKLEEEKLNNRFGAPYENYLNSVRRWI